MNERIARAVGMFAWCLAACGGEDHTPTGGMTGPTMRPGDNCLSCHRPNGTAPPWSAAGTVYRHLDARADEGLQGARVHITDAEGKALELVTNEAGNFYTPEPLVAPLRITVEADGVVRAMPQEAPAGSCNACHSHPDPLQAKGRIFAGNQR